jgi:tyrosyl-tRNA synthetase
VDNAIFTNNADWFAGMLYLDFLRDIGSKFSVNRMLQAESVQMRLNSEVGVSFLEFNYMILQGYDFLHLYRTHGCRLQLGGQDQWGNITCGTELVRRLEQNSVYGLTMPLLMDKDGNKFGKSNGQAVWLDANRYSTFDYYQFWRNTDDSQVEKLMLGFTALPVDEIKRLCAPGGNINRAKEILAYEATALAHGKAEAEKVFCAAGTKFGFADEAGAIPTSSEIAKIDLAAVRRVAAADLPTFNLELPAEGINIITLLVQAGLCKTNSEARRLIQGGGAYCGDERIAGIDRVVTAADFTDGALILKAGKKNLKRVVID